MKKILFTLPLILFSTLSYSSFSNEKDLDSFPKGPKVTYGLTGNYYKVESVKDFVGKSKNFCRKIKQELSKEKERNKTLSKAVDTNTKLLGTLEDSLQVVKKSLSLANKQLSVSILKNKDLKEILQKYQKDKDDLESILIKATSAVKNPLSTLSEETEKLSVTLSKKGKSLLVGIESLKKNVNDSTESIVRLSNSLQDKERSLKSLEEKEHKQKIKLQKEIELLKTQIDEETKKKENLINQLKKKEIELREATQQSQKYKKISQESAPSYVIAQKMKLTEKKCSNFFLLSLFMTHRDHITKETFKDLLAQLRVTSYCKSHYDSLKEARSVYSNVTRDDTVYRLLTDDHIGLCNKEHSRSPLKVDVEILKNEDFLLNGIYK